MYKKVTKDDIKKFKEISQEVYYGQDIHDDYTHDEMMFYGSYLPEAVVLCESTEEVSKLLAYCHQERIPVVPRGAGTGLCGGAVAHQGGIVLSLEKMDKILEIDHDTMTAVVESGIIYMNFVEEIEKEGLYYAPDPGEKSASIGGNVVTNAGGMRAVELGVTREYVKGMEVVLADGTVETFGGKIAKNSSGYSLKDLIIGSEGTLAIVTKVYLKLLPKPQHMISLLIPFASLDACLNTVPQVYQLPTTPTTLEFVEEEVIRESKIFLGKEIPNAGYPAYLIVSYSGNDLESVQKSCDACADLSLENGAIDVFISDTNERQENMWSARGAFLEAISASTTEMDECDVVVEITKINELLAYVKDLSQEYNVRIRSFGHAGDGNVHIYVCRDQLKEDVWLKTVKEVMDKLYEKAIELDGQVSGEHGIGHAKVEYLEQSVGATQMNLMKGIKQVFDPHLIMNPGKVVGNI